MEDKQETVIRGVTLNDISGVCMIEKECFSDPWSSGMMESSLKDKNQQVFVIEESGKILGYGAVMMVLDECEILRIAVSGSFRRKGLGSRLLDEMIAFGKTGGSRLFYLEVRASNTAAVKLYKKKGFKETGRRKNYYTNPTEDAVLMSYVCC